MKYGTVKKGIFISRPNRFIAKVDVDGVEETVHVKNTGRCRELLVSGAEVILERASAPERKTGYDLVAVYKGERLINMDSQAPNKVFGEWAAKSGFFGNITLLKPECTYKSSRFDYYIEADGRRIFVEVKGVTLENDGVLMFPDAPTLRGVKHLNELADAKQNGYQAYVFFVAQMTDCKYFTPNAETHPLFAETLKRAAESGVGVVCLSCNVTLDGLEIDGFVDVVL